MMPAFDPAKEKYRVKVGQEWYDVKDHRQVDTAMRLAHGPDAWVSCECPEGQTLYVRSGQISVIRKVPLV